MKKKMPAKKLQLSRETLQNLHEVVGGAIGGKTNTIISKVVTYCYASCGCATDPC
jgi:hypothetical protein